MLSIFIIINFFHVNSDVVIIITREILIQANCQERRQPNSNQSQLASGGRNLCCTKLTSFGKSRGAIQLGIWSVVEMALQIEMVVNLIMNRNKFL